MGFARALPILRAERHRGVADHVLLERPHPWRHHLGLHAAALPAPEVGRRSSRSALLQKRSALRQTGSASFLRACSRLKMREQKHHVDRTGGGKSGNQHGVHRGLQNRPRSMNETRVKSPKVCFSADSYLVYGSRRDSRRRHVSVGRGIVLCPIAERWTVGWAERSEAHADGDERASVCGSKAAVEDARARRFRAFAHPTLAVTRNAHLRPLDFAKRPCGWLIARRFPTMPVPERRKRIIGRP
jgi:hypothetical protein